MDYLDVDGAFPAIERESACFVIARHMRGVVEAAQSDPRGISDYLRDLWSALSIEPARYRGFGRPLLEPLLDDDAELRVWADWERASEQERGAGWYGELQTGRGLDDLLEARTALREIAGERSAIPRQADSVLILDLLPSRTDWEVIGLSRSLGRVSTTLGYDVGWYADDKYGAFYSILSDSAILPRWHGPDDDALPELAEHTRQLNEHVLFPDGATAQEFHRWYRKQPWGEDFGYEDRFEIIRVDEIVSVSP